MTQVSNKKRASWYDVIGDWRKRLNDERAEVDKLLSDSRIMGDALARIYNRVSECQLCGEDNLRDEIESLISEHLSLIAMHSNDLPEPLPLYEAKPVRVIRVFDPCPTIYEE